MVIDYRTQDFEEELSGYDLVLDSVGGENLEKSLRVLRPGGKAIGIAGPPDPAFARAAGLNPLLRLAIAALSGKVRRQATQARRRPTSSCSCTPAASSCARSPRSSTPASCAPSSGKIFPFDETPQALDGLRSDASAARPSSLAA